ncbi:hypothetical protein FM106_23050 [Brachybacterium faecium]|nr:hypothetical protein FM106_23050 [Brachybacterium faecium]
MQLYDIPHPNYIEINKYPQIKKHADKNINMLVSNLFVAR